MARVEVSMPQMGESIAEGTVSKWLKQPGDAVARDEPLLEISTDKVDAEIPSPAAGVLAEVAVAAGQTVEVGATLGYIETDAAIAVAAPAGGGSSGATSTAASNAAPEPSSTPPPAPERSAQPPRPAALPAAAATQRQGGEGQTNGREESAEDRLRQRSTPLVRRIAAEHGVDIAQVHGTGQAGRVTKQDLMAFMEQGPAPAQATEAAAPARVPAGTAPVSDGFWATFYGPVEHPEFAAREGDRVVPMDRIRKLTADHMVRAKRIAPHVHSFIEIDFTQIDRVRARNKAGWAQQDVKVSYTAFVAWACARVLRDFPMVNATISGNSILYRGGTNIGIAVDLNPGLIVPVVKDAADLNLVGIARRINDLALRAREKKLKPDEIQGATFSITNPGVLGTIVGMPIIPEGTAAILGTGAIEKRVVVVETDGQDTMAIRKRAYFSLGYDHRLVDGADAARFLSSLKAQLESFPETG